MRPTKVRSVRRVAENSVAFASFAFIVAALEKFFPHASGIVESKAAAAGMVFVAWLKTF
jgi:hypothetical protein